VLLVKGVGCFVASFLVVTRGTCFGVSSLGTRRSSDRKFVFREDFSVSYTNQVGKK
jgi:hypothetical protein